MKPTQSLYSFKSNHYLLDKGYKVSLISLFLLVFLVNKSLASHYRYGNISWSRTNDTSRTVKFIIRQAYRINYFVASPGVEAVGNIIPTEVLDYGDGHTDTIKLLVTSVNTSDEWFYGIDTLIHTYPANGSTYMAFYASCCRLDLLETPTTQNNPDGDYSLQTIIKFVSGNLGSPVCTLAPAIELAVGNSSANFTIPATNPNGAVDSFILSTYVEAADGGSYTQPLGLGVNILTGVVTFSTVGKNVNDLYNSAITIKDASGSKIMVDFIIKIVPVNFNPVFISPTPALNSFRVIPTCVMLRDTIKATTSSSSVTTQLFSASVPNGATLSNAIPTALAPTTTTILNWTPLPSDYGIKTISFLAKNSNNLTTSHSYQVAPNTSPYFISIPNTIACVNIPYTYSVIAIDPDVGHGDALQTNLFATSLPSWLTYTSNGNGTGVLSGTPSFANIGSYTISFIAVDIYHNYHPNVIQSFTLNVGNCTINNTSIIVKAKVMLCGALDAATGLMQDSLRAAVTLGDPTGPIPIPYLIPPHIPLSPPYFLPSNGATIGAGVLSVSGANAIVDWVYIEIRNASNNSIVVASQHALVQRDGDIVSSSDGISPLYFPTLNAGNYWVSVRHRNHLGVMTANPIPLSSSPGISINFSDPFISVWTKPCVENNARCKLVITPLGCVAPLWGGNANNNKNVKYSGFANDKEAIFNAVIGAVPPGYPFPSDAYIVYGYRNEDVNMNGKVQFSGEKNDKDWLLDEILNSNLPIATPNDVLEEHLPN